MAELSAIRHVALDLDGTLYAGGTLFAWTPGFLATLAELGLGRTFLTNNSSRSRAEYQRHLAEFGIAAAATCGCDGWPAMSM